MSAPARAPRVLVGVTGGIAAYKACEVLRGLQRAGCDVRVCMTADACQFVGPTTFAALSGHPVVTGLYDDPETAIPHIELASWADAAVVVPATANVLAKMACGIADDALTSTLLALACPTLVAPAMNVHMWQHPATQANVATLRARGVTVVEPACGRLACGDVGEGKLAEVDDVVAAVLAALGSCDGGADGSGVPAGGETGGGAPLAAAPAGGGETGAAPSAAPEGDLRGLALLVNAGPTHEAVDPVRYIANASTGKMGFAIAAEAARRGARVTLVAGPCALPTPEGVRRVDVVSAAQMRDACAAAFEGADAAVLSAAVADYTPAHPADHKLKKAAEPLERIELVRTADILAELSATKGARVVVGFAAETNDLLANARAKLAHKGCDLVVANDVSRADSTFGSDTSRVALVSAQGVEQHETLPLPQVAALICDRVRDLVAARRGTGAEGGTVADAAIVAATDPAAGPSAPAAREDA